MYLVLDSAIMLLRSASVLLAYLLCTVYMYMASPYYRRTTKMEQKLFIDRYCRMYLRGPAPAEPALCLVFCCCIVVVVESGSVLVVM